ncbi:MAG: hypothetical protein EOM66_08175 [Clostridia bacterium]|nr:hypothetical protein [Clostridia bacterium]
MLEIEKASWCARPLYTTDAESAWLAPRREDGGAYLALFNVSDQPRRVSLALDNAGLAVPVGGLRATELWSGESLSGITRLAAELPPHDAAVWRVF